jgi:glycosyltransferase involved in cell wall biosynthesis
LKALILAYDFPPLISIGAQRPYSWYKYLPQHNIQVIVVTRHWDEKIASPIDYVKATPNTSETKTDEKGNIIICAPFRPNLRDKILIRYGYNRFVLLRKMLSYIYSILEYISFRFENKASIYFEALKAIKQYKPDIIIATGEPFILFKYAYKLSKRFGIPWIADYRDGWTTNQANVQHSALQNLQHSFFRFAERRYINTAGLITTAAPAYAAAIGKLFPNREVNVIYNGFDEDYFKDAAQIKPSSEKFIITYAGTLYPHQNIEMFLNGLKQFVTHKNLKKGEVEVHFYGMESQTEAKLRLLNFDKSLADFLICEPRITYAELAKKMMASHLLLLLSKNGADWLNAKIFDYLAAKRPILLVENDHGILEKLLLETNGGAAFDNAQQVSDFLQTEFEKFQKGIIETAGPDEAYLKYSRKQQADAFAALISTLPKANVS